MKLLRRIVKIFLLLLWSILCAIPAALSLLTVKSWARVRQGAFWAQVWTTGAARIAGVKVIPHGSWNKNQGKLLVSNHLGYLDILAHGSLFPIRFTPKAEIRKWFFLGPQCQNKIGILRQCFPADNGKRHLSAHLSGRNQQRRKTRITAFQIHRICRPSGKRHHIADGYILPGNSGKFSSGGVVWRHIISCPCLERVEFKRDQDRCFYNAGNAKASRRRSKRTCRQSPRGDGKGVRFT